MTNKELRRIEREYNRIGYILAILALGAWVTWAVVLLTR
jgi:hypothetical protein